MTKRCGHFQTGVSYLNSPNTSETDAVEVSGLIHITLVLPKPILLAQTSASATQPHCEAVLVKIQGPLSFELIPVTPHLLQAHHGSIHTVCREVCNWMLPIPLTAHRVPARLEPHQIYSQTASLGLKASVSMSIVRFIHISRDFLVLYLITGSIKYEEIMQLASEMMATLFPLLLVTTRK